jgi:hypothetical protein
MLANAFVGNRGKMLSGNHLVRQQVSGPTLLPIGRVRARHNQEMSFLVPIKFLMAERCALLPLEGCLQADGNKGLPCAFNGPAPHVEGLTNVLIGPRRAWRTLIGLQQNARPREFVSGGFACGNQGQEVLSFCIGSRDFVALGWHAYLLGK